MSGYDNNEKNITPIGRLKAAIERATQGGDQDSATSPVAELQENVALSQDDQQRIEYHRDLTALEEEQIAIEAERADQAWFVVDAERDRLVRSGLTWCMYGVAAVGLVKLASWALARRKPAPDPKPSSKEA